jgi:hypothetical protein
LVIVFDHHTAIASLAEQDGRMAEFSQQHYLSYHLLFYVSSTVRQECQAGFELSTSNPDPIQTMSTSFRDFGIISEISHPSVFTDN